MRYYLIYALIALAGGSVLTIDACGPYHIEHDVSGTVQVQVELGPASFVAFFLSDCATRVSGQACYDADPAVCATCMANALFATLPVLK